MQKPKLVAIVGPTATGKTRLGVKLASQFNGEIVSADSRQVYRGMDIGTGKDLKEYLIKTAKKTKQIPYHLIDVASPQTKFDLSKYQKKAFKAIDDIGKRGKVPFLVGGSGLYVQAVIDNYDLTSIKPNKKLRKKLEEKNIEEIIKDLKKVSRLNSCDFKKIIREKNKRRLIRYLEYCLLSQRPLKDLFLKKDPRYEVLVLGITFPREVIYKKIEKRLKERLLKEDMLGEVERLHKCGVSWKRMEELGLEYKWLSRYLRKKISYEEMFQFLLRDIKRFSKRQMTWFKKDKRIIWIKNQSQAKKLVKDFLKK